jgi:hypothetical protein
MLSWQHLNDYEFVKLVGELLARLGFVDVDYQGDGPDGGVDLFATELLPFTIQGRVPFRWAIQCKFSRAGLKAAVNDAEVRDVEGILRSDRYQSQNPRGYMLVTNRRIAQNVIERLRGVDRQSHFRTARLDGSGLASILAEHPALSSRYLDPSRGVVASPEKPKVIAPPSAGATRPQAPTVMVALANPASETQSMSTRAILDTGAEISCIPRPAVDLLRLQPVDYISLQRAAGPEQVPMYLVRMRIEHGPEHLVRVLALHDTMLIGRDVLNQFTVVWRPDGGMELY